MSDPPPESPLPPPPRDDFDAIEAFARRALRQNPPKSAPPPQPFVPRLSFAKYDTDFDGLIADIMDRKTGRRDLDHLAREAYRAIYGEDGILGTMKRLTTNKLRASLVEWLTERRAMGG